MPDTTTTEIIPADPEWVERRGLIFKFGSYPDKGFSLTPEEYAAANAGISGVPIDLSHTPTILDGNLGHLFAAEVKGDELHGTVRLPKWLDDVLDAGKRKVSCEWDRATKRLRKLSLVPEPRIPDAVLMAAFSAAHPEAVPAADPSDLLGGLVAAFTARKRHPTLDRAMQHIHDLMALYPNGCPGVASVAEFGDVPKQRKAVRAIHDTTLDHGATCPAKRSAAFADSRVRRFPMNWNPFRKAVAALPDEPTDSDLAAVFGQLVEAKADDPEPTPAPSPKPPTTPPPPPPASFADSPEARALQSKIAELERKAAEREAAERASRAAAFAQQAKDAHRITPAMEADLSALFSQALADDATAEAKVTFSEGSATKQGSRLDALAAFVAKLPRHSLTADLIDPKDLPLGTNALFNGEARSTREDPEARGRRLFREGVGSAY